MHASRGGSATDHALDRSLDCRAPEAVNTTFTDGTDRYRQRTGHSQDMTPSSSNHSSNHSNALSPLRLLHRLVNHHASTHYSILCTAR